MKTAVSLPDSIHRDADRLAKRLGKSRSRLYSEALKLYLARHDEDAITEALNAVSGDHDAALAPELRSAALAVLGRTKW